MLTPAKAAETLQTSVAETLRLPAAGTLHANATASGLNLTCCIKARLREPWVNRRKKPEPRSGDSDTTILNGLEGLCQDKIAAPQL